MGRTNEPGSPSSSAEAKETHQASCLLWATPGMFMAPSTVSSCLPLAPPPALMALQRSTALLERVVLSTTALGSGEVSATTDSALSRVATKRTPLKSILSTRPVTGEARTEPTSGLLTMSPAPRVPGLAMSMSLLSTSIMKGLINGQYPSHWIATKRSDKEVDVWGTVTLKVEGGGTYTAYVHEYMQFYEPCVTINRHYWKLEYLAAEYYPTHWYHKEAAVVDPNWTWGNVTDKTTFSWHLSGSLNNKAISADGYGYGHGYRQHHWGKGGKGFG